MNNLPITLVHLDTCTSSYFQGSPHPVIGVPVDALTEKAELRKALLNDDEWSGVPDVFIGRAVTQGLDADGQYPFPYLAPDKPPRDQFVSRHPTIDSINLVIDKESGEVLSSWDTYEQAICAAWRGTDDPTEVEQVYAYYAIVLEAPPGWSLDFNNSLRGWSAAERRTGVSLGLYDTALDAKVVAWRRHSRNVATSHEQLQGGLIDMIEKGRLTEADIPDDYDWLTESLALLADNKA